MKKQKRPRTKRTKGKRVQRKVSRRRRSMNGY